MNVFACTVVYLCDDDGGRLQKEKVCDSRWGVKICQKLQFGQFLIDFSFFFFISWRMKVIHHFILICVWLTHTQITNTQWQGTLSHAHTGEIVWLVFVCLCLYNNIQTKSSCHFLCAPDFHRRFVSFLYVTKICICIFYQHKSWLQNSFCFPHPPLRRRLFREIGATPSRRYYYCCCYCWRCCYYHFIRWDSM